MTTDIYTQNLLQKRAQEIEQLSLELAELKANYQFSLAREKTSSEMAFKFTQECKAAVERADRAEQEAKRLQEALNAATKTIMDKEREVTRLKEDLDNANITIAELMWH